MFRFIREFLFGKPVEAQLELPLPTPVSAPLNDLIMAAYNERGLAGFTADECANKLGASINKVRPRVTELFQAGKLRKTTIKRATYSGAKAVVLVTNRYNFDKFR